jgi:hypothetical protein
VIEESLFAEVTGESRVAARKNNAPFQEEEQKYEKRQEEGSGKTSGNAGSNE